MKEKRTQPFRRCSTWLGVAGLVLLLNGGCSKPADVTETGALLIKLSTPTGAPQPDELRVSVYDDSGTLFKAARVPQQGALPASVSGRPLGTVLVQPGDSSGPLRVHVRGLRLGARVLDGVNQVTDEARKLGVLDLLLEITVLVDADDDDVPDLIDDCPDQADPDQKRCPGGNPAPPKDAGAGTGAANGESKDGNGSDGAAAEGPAATGVDGGGSGGATQTGGTAGTAGTTGNTGGGIGDVVNGGIGSGGTGTGGAGTGDMGTGATSGTPDAGSDGAPNGARRALGSVCATSTECASGFCVDRVCCQTICNQPCQACGTAGRCFAVVRARDTPECAGNKSCNSTGRCVGD